MKSSVHEPLLNCCCFFHIKVEPEELWTTKEGDRFEGLEEADVSMFTFTLNPVISEGHEANAQSSRLPLNQTENAEAELLVSRSPEQTKTQADKEDRRTPEPAWKSPACDDSSNTVAESDEDDWKEPTEPQSASNTWTNDKVPVSDMGCNTGFS